MLNATPGFKYQLAALTSHELNQSDLAAIFLIHVYVGHNARLKHLGHAAMSTLKQWGIPFKSLVVISEINGNDGAFQFLKWKKTLSTTCLTARFMTMKKFLTET